MGHEDNKFIDLKRAIFLNWRLLLQNWSFVNKSIEQRVNILWRYSTCDRLIEFNLHVITRSNLLINYY